MPWYIKVKKETLYPGYWDYQVPLLSRRIIVRNILLLWTQRRWPYYSDTATAETWDIILCSIMLKGCTVEFKYLDAVKTMIFFLYLDQILGDKALGLELELEFPLWKLHPLQPLHPTIRRQLITWFSPYAGWVAQVGQVITTIWITAVDLHKSFCIGKSPLFLVWNFLNEILLVSNTPMKKQNLKNLHTNHKETFLHMKIFSLPW